MTGGPWYKTSICKKLHREVFDRFIKNARTHIYNIMFSVDAHEKEHPTFCDGDNRGRSFPLP